MTEEVPARDLSVGDLVDVLGWRRIVAIRPYDGRHDFILGIAETVPSGPFSVEEGQYYVRVRDVRRGHP